MFKATKKLGMGKKFKVKPSARTIAGRYIESNFLTTHHLKDYLMLFKAMAQG